MPSDIFPAEKAAPATCLSLFFLDFRAHLGVCGETDAQHGLATPVRSYMVQGLAEGRALAWGCPGPILLASFVFEVSSKMLQTDSQKSS